MISSDEIPNLDDPEKLDPMSWAGQLSYLSVEVARTHVLNVQRAEAEARYRAKVLENIAIHKASRQVQAERRVLAMLCKQPGAISTADLAHKLGQDRGSARYALMRLVERSKAANVGSQKRQLWIATEKET